MHQKTTDSFRNKRIAIFEPRPKFMINPCLVSLLNAFTANGARVDVMMPVSSQYPSVDGMASRYPFPRRFSLWDGGFRTTLLGWWERIQRIRVDRMFRKGSYDLILGIDSAGMIKGYEYAKRYNVPLVYMSFEIFFRDELSSALEFEEKNKECSASRFADLVVIQDETRARLLAAENRLSPDKFEYLPVSPDGSQKQEKTDFLRKRFNISAKQIIVLHSGTFDKWTYADELLENVVTWPDDFVLVIHTRYNPNYTDGHIRTIKQNRLPNVIFSTDILPVDAYGQLVASSDIGLVLYKTVSSSPYTQKNIQNIGLSSGKFSYYTRYGIPVITIKQKTYAQLLTNYAFGENLDSFDEMPAALNRVRSNIDHHRMEAQRLFSEKIDFAVHWPKLSYRLLEIME